MDTIKKHAKSVALVSAGIVAGAGAVIGMSPAQGQTVSSLGNGQFEVTQTTQQVQSYSLPALEGAYYRLSGSCSSRLSSMKDIMQKAYDAGIYDASSTSILGIQ